MSICNKQHLSNILGSTHEKTKSLSLKNALPILKACNLTLSVFDAQFLNSMELLDFCKHFIKLRSLSSVHLERACEDVIFYFV